MDQYAFKVTQANRTQLVVIMYDIIEDYIRGAKEAFEASDFELFDKEVKNAQKFVRELMATLNMEYEISKELMVLYLYLNQELIAASVKKNGNELDGLVNVISRLRSAFDTISKTDYSGAVMHDAEQVYAGLTYHKTNLNESLVSQDQGKRGFTV